MQPHERFDAWKLCHGLTLAVYRETVTWPQEERFGLISQVRRAAVSASVNIVEGSAKRGSAEFRRFLDISNGSIAEVGYLLLLARELNYLSPDRWAALQSRWEIAAKKTMALYRSLSPRKA